ncbi:MAG: 30S ribosomal protein S4 [Elusimicrobiales bacterium]
MKYTQPTCKRCRSLNEKLYLKGSKCYSNCIMEIRKNAIKQRKLSDYGRHLREKQIVKNMYLLSERQFKRYFNIASKAKGRTGETLLRLLETRLDNIVRRIGFAASIKHARQLVSHRHIKVNGSVVTIPSYLVKEGDEISLANPTLFENIYIKKSLEDTDNKGWRPSWIVYDGKSFSAKIVRMPDRSELNSKINEQLIVEFYSK